MARSSVLIFTLSAFAAICASAQDAVPLRFEAASIHPRVNLADGLVGRHGGPGTSDPTHLRIGRFNLRTLLCGAFGIKDYQLEAPGWLASSYFDIAALVPAGATREQSATMMRNLLIERFGLRFHMEKKPLPVYTLVVARKAEWMRASASRGGEPEESATFNGSDAKMVVRQKGIAGLVERIGYEVDRPVLDFTGLTGTYSFTLTWTSERGGAIRAEAVSADSASAEPDIYSALQSQLGLWLEKRTVPFPFVVVDGIGKTPTDN